MNNYIRFGKKTTFSKELASKELNNSIKETETMISVDSLLDEYNDYVALYHMFWDMDYKLKADRVMEKIKKMHK